MSSCRSTDNGKGMDAETLEKAIDPFFSTKELGKGTGLGLSMIHGLAIQMKGMLKLTSEVGKGTMAALWIPAAEQDLVRQGPGGGSCSFVSDRGAGGWRRGGAGASDPDGR